MFIGHFAAAFAAKKFAPKVNLAILFIACQLADLIWPVLLLLGIEKVSVDHSATAVMPFDFVHYPYSHSLLMLTVYAALLGLTIKALYKSNKAALIAGLTVISHWVLDLITHRPDMPLTFGGAKYGWGLWNSVPATLIVEGLFFVYCVYLYKKSKTDSAQPFCPAQKKSFYALVAFLVLAYLGNLFGPTIPHDTPPAAIAGPALAIWLLVIWAYFVDRASSQSQVFSYTQLA